MAEQNHIINIILRARDQTAAAIAEATAKLEGFEKAAEKIGDQQRRSNKQTEKSFTDLSQSIDVSRAEMDKMMRSIENTKGITAKTVDQVIQLEKATKNYIRTLADENASVAEKRKSLIEAENAQRALNKAVREDTTLNKAQAEALTNNIVLVSKQIAQAEELRKVQAQGHRDLMTQISQQKQADADRRKAAAENLTLQQKLSDMESKAHDKRVAQWEDEQRKKEKASKAIIDAANDEDLVETALAAHRKKRVDEDIANQRRLTREALENARRRQGFTREVEAEDKKAFDEEMKRARARLDASKNTRAEEIRGRREELALGRQYLQQIQQIQQIQEARQRALAKGDTVEHVRLEFDNAAAIAEAEKTAALLRATFSKAINIDVDLEDAGAMAHAAEILAMKEMLGKGVKIDVKFDVDQISLARMAAMREEVKAVGKDSEETGNRLSFLRGLVGSLGDGFNQSGSHIAGFDNLIRGLMTLGIALFMNQLILLVGALGGAFLALASSAAMAGAAIGGAFTAGIAQAIPVLGVLGATVFRLKAVFDAVNQSQLVQQQQSYRSAKAADNEAAAHDRVREAQEALSEARDEAKRKLEDLLLAERGLNLSLEENQAAIRKAAAAGQTASLPRLQLQRDTLGVQLGRTQDEIAGREAGKSPEVDAAVKALKQAQAAAKATDDTILAAAGKLDFLLGRMSKAEIALYEAVKKLQDVFRGAAQTVTEPIIKSFTGAVETITKLLGDKKILGAFTDLSQEMADQGTRIFKAFTSPEAIDAFLKFTKEAQKNLAPLTDIILSMSRAFMAVADAAGPALTEILKWVEGIATKIADFFEAGNKSGDLDKFFKDGVTQLKAWGDLLWQVIRLFAAIAGPGGGAKTGLEIIRDLADAIGGMADQINKPGTKLNEFFNRFFRLSKQMLEAFAPVLTAIGKEIDKIFTKDGLKSVQGFVTFLTEILIPALGDFIRTLGDITGKLGEFAKANPEVAKLARAFLSAVLIFGVLSKAISLLNPILKPLGFIAKYLFEASNAGRLLSLSLRTIAIGSGIGLVVGLIVLLIVKLGLFKDLLKALAKPFVEMWKQVQPPVERLVESFKRLSDALGKGSGAFALLKPIMLFLIHILGDVLGSIGKAIGLVIGGIIDVIGGLIDIITGVLSGNWKLAWDGLVKVVVGAARAILGLIELFLFKGMGKIFESLLGVVLKFGLRFGKFFVGAARDAVVAWVRLLFSLPGRALRLLEELVVAFRNGLPNVVTFVGKIGGKIFEAISGGFSKVFNFFKSLPGKLFDLVKNIGGTIANAFKDTGTKIIDNIMHNIKDPVGFAKRIANALIDLVNDAIPNKFGPINIPDNPIKRFKREGGRVGEGFGGGDRVHIVAEEGEWVIRKESVAKFGEGFMAAINRGWGTSGPRKAVGGLVSSDLGHGLGQVEAIPATVINVGADVEGIAHNWRLMLQEMVASTRRNSQEIEERFRNLRENLTATMNRTYHDVKDYIAAIQNSFTTRSAVIVETWTTTFESLKGVTFDGLTYIGHEVNKALKALGSKAIDFGLQKPTASGSSGGGASAADIHAAGFASGGIVGNFGERGRDAVPAWLGRGEAVLNWAHQKLVDPALQATYGFGLPEMFKRTSAFHAGGLGSSPGFARGGGDIYDGHPSNVNANVSKLIRTMKGKFPLVVTSTTDHSLLTTSGNVSDHVGGNAVDLSGAVGIMKSAAEYVKSSGIFRDLKQGIHNPNLSVNRGQMVPDSFWGPVVWAQHASHLHLAIVKAFQALGTTGIGKLFVRGGGALGDLGTAALETVRKIANKFLNRQTSTGDVDIHDIHAGTGGNYGIDALEQLWVAAGGPSNVAHLAAAIAMAESRGDPNVVNSIGASGLWQIFGQVVPGNILDPLINAQNAVKKWRDAGNSFVPWTTYTGADTPGHIPTYTQFLARGGMPAFATGGTVPGPEGSPTPILAHAGEWVLNKVQQSKVAQWLGTGIGSLRDALGFTGGPTSFAGGGDVPTVGRATKGGVFVAPDLNPESLAGIIHDINEIFQAIGNISKKGKIGKQMDAFIKAIRNLTDDGGYLNLLMGEITQIGDRLSSSLARAQAGIKRIGGNFLKRPALVDAVEIANTTVKNLADVGETIRDGLKVAQDGLDDTNAKLRQIRKKGVSSKEQAQYEALIAARNKFQQTIIDLDTEYVKNRNDLFAAQQERFAAQTAKATKDVQDALNTSDFQAKLASIFGKVSEVSRLGDVQLGQMTELRNITNKRMNEALQKSKGDPRWKKIADDLAKDVQKMDEDIASQVVANNKAVIDAINTTASRASTANAIAQRIASARGEAGGQEGFIDTEIKIQTKNRDDLQASLADIDLRNEGLIQTVKDQIAELNATIAEKTAAALQAAIDEVNKATENRARRLALQGRASDLLERIGKPLDAIRGRQATAREAREGSQTDRASLVALQERARREFGEGSQQFKDLTEKIADLDQTIAEQIQTEKELTFTYRSTATAIMTGQVSRTTGLIGTATGIIQQVGALGGAENTQKLLDFAKQVQETLRTAAADVVSNVGQALAGDEFGTQGGGILGQLSAAFQEGPESFATKLAELAPLIASLESTMSGPEKEAFDALIESMINNTTATLDNSQTINSLNGALTQPQSWQSSAWQWFRSAIFTGMGGVLPTFEIPQVHNGGMITRSGVFDLQVGERVMTPGQMRSNGANVAITVNEAGGPVDTEWLASRVGWELKNK